MNIPKCVDKDGNLIEVGTLVAYASEPDCFVPALTVIFDLASKSWRVYFAGLPSDNKSRFGWDSPSRLIAAPGAAVDLRFDASAALPLARWFESQFWAMTEHLGLGTETRLVSAAALVLVEGWTQTDAAADLDLNRPNVSRMVGRYVDQAWAVVALADLLRLV